MELFWTSLFGGWLAPLEVDQDSIAINGLWLQNQAYKISNLNFETTTDLETYSKPLRNWVGFLSNYKRIKNISFKVSVTWQDRNDFINKVDDLRKYIYWQNVNIDIKFKDWEVRRIVWNCNNAPVSLEHYNINWWEFEISFTTLEPFFHKLNNQVRTKTWLSANFREEITAQGTAESELTIYMFFKTGLSWVNEISLTDQRKTITINESIVDNDILVINWLDRSVKLNWVEVDYDGEFLDIFPNTNFIDIAINGTWSADFIFVNKINYA